MKQGGVFAKAVNVHSSGDGSGEFEGVLGLLVAVGAGCSKNKNAGYGHCKFLFGAHEDFLTAYSLARGCPGNDRGRAGAAIISEGRADHEPTDSVSERCRSHS